MASTIRKQCPLCIETYNKSSHRMVKCTFCQFASCHKCTERFLCESLNDPQCMSCKNSWGIDFLLDNFTKKFVNTTLKSHREDLLYDRELALLPATQPLVEKEIAKRHLVARRAPIIDQTNTLLKDFHESAFRYRVAYRHYYGLQDSKYSLAQVCDLQREMTRLQKEYKASAGEVSKFNKKIRALNAVGTNQDAIQKERKQFVRKCPCSGCRGFLSTQYKCGICENYTCSECMEVIGQERKPADHECDPDTVATVKMLAKDTKPCPRCGEMIHKVEGCSQMFCTVCLVAWNWNTGTVVTSGPIHNPHYFAWRNQQNGQMLPRPIGDVPCGGLPDIYDIVRALQAHQNEPSPFKQGIDIFGVNLRVYLQWIGHLHDVVRNRYITNDIVDNVDLRIKFMINDMDEKRFKQLLQMREKARHRKREIEQVIAMLYEVSGDLLRDIRGADNTDIICSKIGELKSLITYAAESMADIRDKYNCTPPAIGAFAYTTGIGSRT